MNRLKPVLYSLALSFLISNLSLAVELGEPNFISEGLFLPGDDEDAFAISADGRFVVFEANDDDGSTRDLYSYNTSSGARVKLNSDLITNGSVEEFWLTPDSRSVVFLAQKFSISLPDLFVVPIQGGAERQLTISGAHDEAVQSEGIVSADSRYFVFRSDRDTQDQDELFSVRLDITEAPQKLNAAIPGGREVDSNYQVSPDSQKVVFRANTNSASSEDLFVAQIDGANAPVRITPDIAAGGGAARTFFISQDSELLVYNAKHSGPNHWYAVSLDGGNSLLLSGPFAVNFSISNVYAALSANGEQFVFQVDNQESSVLAGRRFFSVATDGQTPPVDMSPTAPVGVDANADLESPVFAPDGLNVAYLTEFTDNVTVELFVATADVAQSAIRLSGDLAGTGAGEGVSSNFMFSPNSGSVIYTAEQDTDGIEELYIAPVEGGDTTKLNAQISTGGRVNQNVVFSPDSEYVAFVALKDRVGGGQSAYLARSDGSEVTNLNEALSFNTSDDEGYIIRFSPNQDYLIYEVYIDSLSRYTYQLIELVSEDDTDCFPIKLPSDKVVVPCI